MDFLLSLPVAVLLIPFALLLVFLGIYSYFVWYHLQRYAFYETSIFLITVVYVAGSLFLLTITLYVFLRFPIFQPLFSDGLFPFQLPSIDNFSL